VPVSTTRSKVQARSSSIPLVVAGGPICDTQLSPLSAVLFDLGDEINQPASFAITQNCVTPIPPRFTG
jgi:hypothetical protein